MRITAIRGAGLRRGPDVVEDLNNRPDLMVKRAAQEIENTQDYRTVQVRATYRAGLRQGMLIGVYLGIGVLTIGRIVSIAHESGQTETFSNLGVLVPAQRNE